MIVRYKPTGQIGEIPDDKFDPSLFEPTQDTRVNQSTTPSMGSPSTPEAQLRQQAMQPQGKSVGGFLGNVVKSTGRNVWDIGSAAVNVLNPNLEKNTVANLGRLALGAGELVVPGEQGHEEAARQVGRFYKERYGGKENIGKTLYEDPVGALLDVSAVLGGAGTVARAGRLSKVARVASTASKATDPLRLAGGLVGKGTSKVAQKVGSALEKAGKELPVRGLRANSSQLRIFKNLTGQELADFMEQNKFAGSPEDIMKKAQDMQKPLQKEYNSMVRSGTMVSPKPYIDALKAKAKEIRATDFSPEAQKVANALDQRAKLFKAKSTKNGKLQPVKVDILANTKSSQFGGVPQGAMTDAGSVHAGKLAGGISIEVLDELFPGSARIGKKLQGLKELEEIANKQRGLGKGSFIANIIKPTGVGGVVGGITGGVPGAIAGVGLGLAAESPRVISAAGRALKGIGKTLPPIEQFIGTSISKGGTAGKYGSRVLPSTSPIKENYDKENGYSSPNVHTPVITSPTGESQTLTDIPQNRYTYDNYIADATRDPENEAYYGNLLEKSKQYAGSGGKQIPAAQVTELADIQDAANLMGGLDKVVDQYKDVIGPIQGRIKSANPYDTDAQNFQSQMVTVAQIVGKALEGGVLRQEDTAKYLKILPNITDTLETAKAKIKNVKQIIGEKRKTREQFYKGAGYNTDAGVAPPTGLQNIGEQDFSQPQSFNSPGEGNNTLSSVGQSTLSDYVTLIQKYFPKNQWQNAFNIMIAESGGNPTIPSSFNKYGTEDSHGLFQINLQAHPQMRDRVLNPEENVKYAAQLYRESGWRPWYNSARKLGLLA